MRPANLPVHVHASAPAGALAMPMRPAIEPRRFGVFTFWPIIFVALLNLNAIGWMAFGVQNAVSVVLLTLSICSLLGFRLALGPALGWAGWVLMAFFATFLAIGTAMGMGQDAEQIFNTLFIVRMLVPGILIIANCALAMWYFGLRGKAKQAVLGMYFLGLLIAVSIFAGRYQPDLYRYWDKYDPNRQTGVFGDPNEAGMALCAVAALGFGCMVGERRVWLVVLIAGGLVLCAAALLATYSRSAIMTFAILSLAQLVISPRLRSAWTILAAVGLVGGFLWFFLAGLDRIEGLAPEQAMRLRDITNLLHGEYDDRSTGGRIQAARAGLEQWGRSPLLGNGLGTQRQIEGIMIGSHNTFILILGEAGVIPFVLFVIALVILLKRALRCKVPWIRTLVLSYLCVLFMCAVTLHVTLTLRSQNIMLGTCIGLLSAEAAMLLAQFGGKSAGAQRRFASRIAMRSPALVRP